MVGYWPTFNIVTCLIIQCSFIFQYHKSNIKIETMFDLSKYLEFRRYMEVLIKSTIKFSSTSRDLRRLYLSTLLLNELAVKSDTLPKNLRAFFNCNHLLFLMISL